MLWETAVGLDDFWRVLDELREEQRFSGFLAWITKQNLHVQVQYDLEH